MVDGKYIIDLVLRNNIATDEHPLGVYHPHKELHNIEKESIGLIEVMGLAVLPSRLVEEMDAVAYALVNDVDLGENKKAAVHKEWVENFKNNYPVINKDNVKEMFRQEIRKTFVKVLEHAGVYKRNQSGMGAFDKFIKQI